MKSVKGVRLTLAAIVLIASIWAALPSFAQTADTSPAVQSNNPPVIVETAKPHWYIAPMVTLYMPTNSKTQDRFGSTWTSWGFTIGQTFPGGNDTLDKFMFHLDAIFRSSGENHAYLIPVGIKYTKSLPRSKDFVPFVGATADVFFIDLRSIPDGVDSGLRTTGGLGVFAGADIGKNLTVKANYYAVVKTQGFDLSGLGLALNLRY